MKDETSDFLEKSDFYVTQPPSPTTRSPDAPRTPEGYSRGRWEDGVLVVETDGRVSTEAVEAAYLCGCDGAHSVVRKGLGLDYEGDAYPMTFMLGDVRIDWDRPHDLGQRCTLLEDGELLVDGGIVNSIPIGEAVSSGARHIFVLPVGRIERRVRQPCRLGRLRDDVDIAYRTSDVAGGLCPHVGFAPAQRSLEHAKR